MKGERRDPLPPVIVSALAAYRNAVASDDSIGSAATRRALENAIAEAIQGARSGGEETREDGGLLAEVEDRRDRWLNAKDGAWLHAPTLRMCGAELKLMLERIASSPSRAEPRDPRDAALRESLENLADNLHNSASQARRDDRLSGGMFEELIAFSRELRDLAAAPPETPAAPAEKE